MTVLPKLIFRFNTMSIKILTALFIEMDNIMLTLWGIAKGTCNSQNNVAKKNKVGELTLPDFKPYTKPG